ncbi:hypothetical protein MOQ72_39365 [Saccharopolyspora sp. K220]|nr:hypothetical protein [Saccharopolyspora soli]
MPCARDDGRLRPCSGVLDKLRDRLAELDRRAADLRVARSMLERAIEETERAA